MSAIPKQGVSKAEPHALAKQKCVARTKSGKPCRSWAIAGIDKCRMHCGMRTVDAVAKGRMNLARERIGAYLAEQELTYEDPIQGLLDEVARSATAVRVLGDLVADLQAHPKLVTEEAEGGITFMQAGIYGPNHMGDAKPNVIVAMWNEERDRHARVCKLAIDAGVSQRQLELEEEKANLLVQAITEMFDDDTLSLTIEQKVTLRKLAATKLRVLPARAS